MAMQADSFVQAVADTVPDESALQHLHDLASVAVEQKSNQLRKRLGNDKLKVTCRYNIN